MEITELIGFIVTILIFLYIMGRNLWELLISAKTASDGSQRQKNLFGMNFNDDEEEEVVVRPQHVERQIDQKKEHKKKEHHNKEKKLITQKHSPKIPPLIQKTIPQPHIENKWESQEQKKPPVTYTKVTNGRSQPSRGLNLIRELKSPKEMIILAEIIGPPKAFD